MPAPPADCLAGHAGQVAIGAPGDAVVTGPMPTDADDLPMLRGAAR
jgi:hypothetical protein